jgi:hypothetical protein
LQAVHKKIDKERALSERRAASDASAAKRAVIKWDVLPSRLIEKLPHTLTFNNKVLYNIKMPSMRPNLKSFGTAAAAHRQTHCSKRVD